MNDCIQFPLPIGVRYAPSGVLVGETRQRHFDGTNLKLRKVPENAHAVLGGQL